MSAADDDDDGCGENGNVESAADLFAWLSREVRELGPRAVPRLPSIPTPLQFHRNFVSPNIPCVITGALEHWRARELWTPEYLRETMGDAMVSLGATTRPCHQKVPGASNEFLLVLVSHPTAVVPHL
jgi:hypothetical protein